MLRVLARPSGPSEVFERLFKGVKKKRRGLERKLPKKRRGLERKCHLVLARNILTADAANGAQHPLPSPSMSSPDGPPSPMKEKVDLAKEKAGERSTPASRAGRDLQRAPKP